MLPSNVFNINKNYYDSDRSLFLQGDNGLLDTVNKRNPEIWDLYKKLKSLDWAEDDVDYSPCNAEFKTCSKSVYEIMIKTLMWQWETDSVAAFNIGPVVAPFVSSSELWTAWSAVTASECLTPDHEVLTPLGWKPIDQITKEDKVAQWDYDTKAVTFVNPSATIKKVYDGEMYHFTNNVKNISQVVTPNHRMPVIYPYWISKMGEFKTANEVKYHGGNGLPATGYIASNGKGMTAREKLYVAVQADGSLCSEKYTGGRTGKLHYRFNLKKARKIERLYSLAAEAGWEITELVVSRFKIDGIRSFMLHVPKEEYNWKAKTFDWFNYDEISYEWAVDFINELQYWDGNLTGNKRIRFITGNKACADKASTVAHIAGIRAHTTVIPERTNVLMPSGGYSDTKEAYQVYFQDRQYLVGNTILKNKVYYKGFVYCLTVPSSYFFVKHNNAITITGNCLHSTTYSEIVRNSFDNPKDVIESVLQNVEAFNRLEIVANVFSNTKTVGHKVGLGLIDRTSNEAYDAIMLYTFALMAMERIQFMSSFAITFGIADSGLFMPIGKIVQKICADELNVHVEVDKAVLVNELKTKKGEESFKRIKSTVEAVISEVVNSELRWNNHLFQDGRELVGMNQGLLDDWTLFAANDVYDFTGLKNPFKEVKKNPLGFITDWIDLNTNQASPQEEKTANYLLGGLKDTAGDKVYDIDDI